MVSPFLTLQAFGKHQALKYLILGRCSPVWSLVRSTALTANPHWASSLQVWHTQKLTKREAGFSAPSRNVRHSNDHVELVLIDKRIRVSVAENNWRVSQEKTGKEMRGQRDGVFAAGKQLRECVGNVGDGSLGEGKGAGAYLKTFNTKRTGRGAYLFLFIYLPQVPAVKQAGGTYLHFLILQVNPNFLPPLSSAPSFPCKQLVFFKGMCPKCAHISELAYVWSEIGGDKVKNSKTSLEDFIVITESMTMAQTRR